MSVSIAGHQHRNTLCVFGTMPCLHQAGSVLEGLELQAWVARWLY